MREIEDLNNDVSISSYSYDINLRSLYEDLETGKTHSLVWWFEPDISETPEKFSLRVTRFLHKDNKEDSDNIYGDHIESKSMYYGGEANLSSGVQDVLEDIFGKEATQRTFSKDNVREGFDCSANLYNFDLSVTGGYTENDYDHMVHWKLRPKEKGIGFRIYKCMNKRWTKKATADFTEKYDGEEILDIRKGFDQSPKMDTLPDSVLNSLCRTFGNTLISKSVNSLPKNIYNCIECGKDFKSNPSSVCPFCGEKKSLIHFRNEESYLNHDSGSSLDNIIEV